MATETWRLYFVVRGESEEKAITISSDTVVTDCLTTFLTSHSLKGYANRVSAWKLHSPTPTPDLLPLIRPGRKMEQIATRMELYRCLRDYFEDSPPKDDQGSHIVFEFYEPPPPQRPQPSSHFLSLPGATFQFLKDLHTQLWGKRHLKGEVFRTATITPPDYVIYLNELEKLREKFRPEPLTQKQISSYQADFLRYRSRPSDDISGGIEKDGSGDAENKGEDDEKAGAADQILSSASADVLGSLFPIPPEVADGLTSILPCEFRYMDLTNLPTVGGPGTPRLMFIRDVCDRMAQLIDQTPNGQEGCMIITGQPGIGKTCYLYYNLILRILNEQPTLFQDRYCKAFLIKDEVYELPPHGLLYLDRVYAEPLPEQDIFALVDGDGPNSVPQQVLINENIKIVLVSSPKTRDARGWHIQNVMQDIEQTVTMEGWTWKDLAIYALFMAGYDISLYRLQLSVAVCGLVPRTCVAGAISAQALQHQMDSVMSSLKVISHNIPQLALAIQIGIHASEQTFLHHVLHLHADDARPQLTSAIVRPVSQWALNAIDAELATSREGAALELYEQVQGASSWRGNMWKRRVHAFFRSLPSERTFEIQSLDDRSHTLKITFPPAGFSLAFGPTQSFTGHLTTCMKDPKHSAYLTPISPVFATFDSFLYQRDFKVPGFRPLVGLQMTDAETHPVGITGLQEVQALLKPDTALEDLCPLVPHKWIFVFVVPEHMAASFPKQTYKEPSKKQKDPVGTWDKKVSQYVLGLGSEVWRCRAVAYHQETAL